MSENKKLAINFGALPSEKKKTVPSKFKHVTLSRHIDYLGPSLTKKPGIKVNISLDCVKCVIMCFCNALCS